MRPLREVVRLHYGKAISKDVRKPEGPVPVYGANGVMDYCTTALADGPSLIIGRKGSAGAINLASGAFWASDVTYFTDHDTGRIDFGFMHYLLHQLDLPSLAKGVKPGINRDEVYSLHIPLPPLDEQKRIVAVLDEAFEDLDRACANAEANLIDAREVFERALNTRLKAHNADWHNCLVANSYRKTKVPAKVQRKQYLAQGCYPIVSQEADFINGYWNIVADVVEVSRPLVVFGDHTRHLKYVDFDFVVGADGTQIMSPIPEIDPKFYYYALRCIPLAGKGYARHFSHLKKEVIRYPRQLSEQIDVADELEELEARTKDLASVYAAQYLDIDALRQSLLQKAFSGELT